MNNAMNVHKIIIKGIKMVEIEFIKDTEEGYKKGDIVKCSKSDASEIINKGYAKEINKRVTKARYLQDKATLDKPEIKGLINKQRGELTEEQLKTLKILPKNWKIWKEEQKEKQHVEIVKEKVENWSFRWKDERAEVINEIKSFNSDIYSYTELKNWVVEKATQKKKQEKILKDEEQKTSLTDIYSRMGQAKQFLEIQPVYYDENKIWWSWEKNSAPAWKMCDEIDIINMVQEIIDEHGIKSNERTEILNSLKQAGRKLKPEPAKLTWIQFSNGIIDLENEEEFLIQPKPIYFITNPLKHKYSNNDETPTMDKIFTEWVGEEHAIQLYEIIAYCMLPDMPIHRLFILLGAGLNGKSCFLKLLENFIGKENCVSTDLDVLMTSRFEMAKLHKKLVCLMGETDFNEIKSTQRLKRLTGHDKVGIEIKNKNPFDFINYAKIIIATNSLPTTNDKTVGFFRRPIIIDFPNRFDEKKNILDDIPPEEYENLGKKCVRILKGLLKKRTFTNEGSIEDRMKRYEDRSNPFDKFWEEAIEETFDDFITVNQFKKRLNEWCKQNRFREISDYEINKRMKEKNINQDRRRLEWFENDQAKVVQARVWMGLKWK